jgi:UDP-2-acetamido-3-amino-2,3-dideoxy-glucuronate N-acetyltransferase
MPQETSQDTSRFHPHALVDPGATVGAGTRVWAFAHICDGVVIGEDCNLCDHTFFEKGVRIGSRVTVKCGVYLWDGVKLEDDVFVGPCAAFTNDRRPRSKQYPESFAETRLLRGCSIGANATLLPITVGRWAMVAAGAVATRDVPDFGLVMGNPARLAGWVCRCGERLHFQDRAESTCLCGRNFQKTSESSIRETTP